MTQQRQLFGTDGIRGVAGEFPLTKQSTYLIGRALGHDLVRSNHKAQAVIGQDTRERRRMGLRVRDLPRQPCQLLALAFFRIADFQRVEIVSHGGGVRLPQRAAL